MISLKSFIVILCCYILSCSGSVKSPKADFFEGKISYKISVTRKTDKYDSLILDRVTGTTSDYYFKHGNSLIKNHQAISTDLIYRVAENKMYTKRIGNDTLFWEHCNTPGSPIINYAITPGKETILGILCDELRVVFEDKIITNYYNADTLRIDPGWHKNYTLGNQDFYSEKKKALSLKFVIDKPDFTIIYTATAINPGKLNDDIFSIPASSPLKAWEQP